MRSAASIVAVWAYVESRLSHVGPSRAMLSHLGLMLGQVGLYWPSLTYVGHCWAMLGYVGLILGPCWAYVGPMLAYVGPMWTNVEPSWELC